MGGVGYDGHDMELTGITVYGAENVSSGASSDIKNATSTATNMVKVRCWLQHDANRLTVWIFQRWGFSKLGPIFYDNDDASMSPRRKEEIEDEIARCIFKVLRGMFPMLSISLFLSDSFAGARHVRPLCSNQRWMNCIKCVDCLITLERQR